MAYFANRDAVGHGLLVGRGAHGTEGWRARVVNGESDYAFHAGRSVYSSLSSFCLSIANPMVSAICYLYFFIAISVFNLPLSMLLAFLCINIPLLGGFWSAVVCQSGEDVSRGLVIDLAVIADCTQAVVLLLAHRWAPSYSRWGPGVIVV